jgi:hypothetical protein
MLKFWTVKNNTIKINKYSKHARFYTATPRIYVYTFYNELRIELLSFNVNIQENHHH